MHSMCRHNLYRHLESCLLTSSQTWQNKQEVKIWQQAAFSTHTEIQRRGWGKKTCR